MANGDQNSTAGSARLRRPLIGIRVPGMTAQRRAEPLPADYYEPGRGYDQYMQALERFLAEDWLRRSR